MNQQSDDYGNEDDQEVPAQTEQDSPTLNAQDGVGSTVIELPADNTPMTGKDDDDVVSVT